MLEMPTRLDNLRGPIVKNSPQMVTRPVDLMTDCVDCGVNTCPTEMGPRAETFMVHDHVWAQAGMTEDGGHLCVGCIEARLGRQLVADDFIDCKLNDLSIADVRYAWSWRTPRLISRLSGRPTPPTDFPADRQEDSPSTGAEQGEENIMTLDKQEATELAHQIRDGIINTAKALEAFIAGEGWTVLGHDTFIDWWRTEMLDAPAASILPVIAYRMFDEGATPENVAAAIKYVGRDTAEFLDGGQPYRLIQGAVAVDEHRSRAGHRRGALPRWPGHLPMLQELRRKPSRKPFTNARRKDETGPTVCAAVGICGSSRAAFPSADSFALSA